jgi:glycosyltransferase involved in cell wall biosynthesis
VAQVGRQDSGPRCKRAALRSFIERLVQLPAELSCPDLIRFMRIVHIDTAHDLRGGQHQLLLLARGLRERAHKQIIVCPESSALAMRAQRECFRTFELPAYDPAHAHGILQFRQSLLGEPADIVHAHDGKGQTIARLACAGVPARPRTIASRRVTFSPTRSWSTRLKYDWACDGVIAVSESIRSRLIDSGVASRKVEVIYDGVEVPKDLPGAEVRAASRALWGFHADEFVTGHLGAFTWEKGQDLALEAIRLLSGDLPQVRLVLAGYSPTGANTFARLINSAVSEVGDRIRLLGYAEDLMAFLAGLDLYVMPSRAEGLGSSGLIAMAHGVPVVATRVGGLPEIVQPGRTGWLVEPGSPRALADAVRCAASDRLRLGDFGVQARERAQQFSSDKMVERTEAFYGRVAAGSLN